jgi:hypothetical protein
MLFSQVSSDNDKNTGDIYCYEKKFYYNPCLTLRMEIDIFLSNRWFLICTPQYTAFFEPTNVGQFLAIGVSVKMLF